ncbi:hypothetical protein BDD12DRAFT_874026 [Trichophaea hybrida]|nr:hypothetical protein BDD12DRAFT_874026 [Trichophaea hybrida]
MFLARIISTLPRRRFYTYLPSSAPTPGFALLHSYSSTHPYAKPYNDVSPSNTSSSLTGQVESVEINVAPGIALEGHKRQVVGAVLDLLQGKVTVQKMSRSFWAEDAVFEDNMNKAIGINEVEGHVWSLKTLMKDIKVLNHQVTQVEPNIVMDVENQYNVRSLNTEKVVKSKVVISIDKNNKIKRVMDMWGGSLPEGMLSKALRRVNAYTTAKVVGIPEGH